jgi:alpha-galactosidase
MMSCRERLSLWKKSLFMLAALGLLTLPRTRAAESDLVRATEAPPNGVWLESVDLTKIGAGERRMGRSPHAGRTLSNTPLTLKGVVYTHGIGTDTGTELAIDLHGEAVRFLAMVGMDDMPLASPAGRGFGQRFGGANRPPAGPAPAPTVTFEVWLGNTKVASAGPMKSGDTPQLLTVDLTRAKRMLLVTHGTSAGPFSSGQADWGGALVVQKPGTRSRPELFTLAAEPPPPMASGTSAQPAIHGPRVIGGTPGRPFLFKVSATGQEPLRFEAASLPAGLSLDEHTGILSGSLQRAGSAPVQLRVSGPKGTATRILTIVAGAHKLALTPPLGWNSWNAWGGAIDDAKIRQAADGMVQSGLAAHGFQYINIDDAWMGRRNAQGEIQPNARFPDMKALADYVHSKGLKLGIYSSPGPQTCQRLEGSWQHEAQDALTYGRWGIDYLKYDLCSYRQMIKDRNSAAELQKPYRVMQAALEKTPRDIVYSVCEYGQAKVWEWGPEVGANLWRTTGDIRDSWQSLSRIGFSQNDYAKFAGPGHWNDPDMLVVGRVGWGRNLHPTRLTPNEQITHITLWSMLAAPLLLGCDLTQLDPFTIALLTNDEVLDVNQDPLGKQAWRRTRDGFVEVWARPLHDGTVAAGLFNRGIEAARVTVKWADLGLSGRQPVRDLWQQKDLGAFTGELATTVPAHGAMLVKIGQPTNVSP